MANNFFSDSNKAYSENLNDGILVGNAFDWTISIGLPSDTDGVFPSSSDVVMAKVADVSATPNSNLSIGSTISNSSGSSQTYRLTVYPNFNRFGGFKSISLTADTGVTFYIANKGSNSQIVNNLDYSDLGNVPELKVLKEYDIVITVPNGKSVSGLSFVLQSSSADVYGSINQANVDGLDARLDTIEDTNVVELTSSNYNATIDTAFTITAKVTTLLGDAVSGKSITLYHDGTSVSTQNTNSNGIATWNITPSTWGLHDFNIKNSHCQVNVDGWRIVVGSAESTYKIYRNKTHARLVLSGWYTSGLRTTWNQFGGENYAQDCPPMNLANGISTDGVVVFYVNTNGGIYYKATTSDAGNVRTIDAQFEWAIQNGY